MTASTDEQRRRDQRDITRLQIWASIGAAFASILFGIFVGYLLTGSNAVVQSMTLTGESKVIMQHYGDTLMDSALGWMLAAAGTSGATIGVSWWITARIYRRWDQN